MLGKDNIERGFYGQEIDLTTYNLCRINMFLHNIEFDKFSIVREDTLLSPQHWDDQPFELIVSNPPFSVPWEGDKNPLLINDPRFSPAGVLAPASKGDMAFIMHSLSWLASNGAAAIVCFPGIMYRGGAEQKIRKYLVDNNYVDAIIQLPSNLFLNVTISVDILLLKKNKADNAVLFVDASKEFVKVTKKTTDFPMTTSAASCPPWRSVRMCSTLPVWCPMRKSGVSRIIIISRCPPMWSRRTPVKRLTL